jgi:hypothetical protein
MLIHNAIDIMQLVREVIESGSIFNLLMIIAAGWWVGMTMCIVIIGLGFAGVVAIMILFAMLTGRW